MECLLSTVECLLWSVESTQWSVLQCELVEPWLCPTVTTPLPELLLNDARPPLLLLLHTTATTSIAPLPPLA